MMTYQARVLLNLPVDDVWTLPDGPLLVEFDDGLVETTARETIFSWYFWVYQRLYPKTPLCVRHHMAGKRLSARSHLDLMGRGLKDCFDAHRGEVEIEDLCRIAYQTTNHAYNELTYRLEEHVATVSIFDYIDVVEHPTIKEANDNVRPNEQSIRHVYGVIEKVLNDPNELIGNALSKSAKSGLVSMGQILQCVGPRGSLTDVDSHIFRRPIRRGYVHGFRDFHDTLVESRSASKSLLLAKDPLAMTEYFNRQMQLAGVVVETVHHADCGSQRYLDWRVKANDLKVLVGKYHLIDGRLAVVSDGDRHLVGKVIKLRTVLGCQHEDPYGVCSTCFGELAYSIPKGTNLGHVATTNMCKEASQKVLSNKHLDSSANIDEIELSEYEQRWIAQDADVNKLRLASRLRGKRLALRLSYEACRNLSDVHRLDQVRRMPVSRFTELEEVMVVQRSEFGDEPAILAVSRGNRHSSLTHEALEWIKEKGFQVLDERIVEIDLTDWDIDQPLFELPMKHANMVDYMKSIERMIKAGRGRKEKTLRSFDTPDAALMELYDLVSAKLTVNVAYLEVIVLSTMIKSSRPSDRFIPKANDHAEFGAYSENIALRSVTASMAYQSQATVIHDPKSYIIKHRPRHTLDDLIIG